MNYGIFRSEPIMTLNDLAQIGSHNKREKKAYKSNPNIKLELTKNNVELVPLKEKYVLKQEDKDKLVSYIDSVSKTNEEYKKIQTLFVTLNNVDTEIKENRDKIKILTENNEALTFRSENLTKNIESKDKEFEELKEENHSLKITLEFWKDKFLRVMSLIKDKLFGKEEREKYFDVSKDLYKKGIY